jgi:cytoskeletal protein CcmA (bactofilin family)
MIELSADNELRENSAADRRAPSPVMPHAPGQAWVEERTRVAVGRNANVSGRLVFQEPVRIEGRFRGEVSSVDLIVVAEGGLIEGRVRTPRLLILGEIRGEVTAARQTVIGPRARVHATIETDLLTICEGARMDADVRMPGGLGRTEAAAIES